MVLNIIAPDDPALDVLKEALLKRPDLNINLSVIPWSKYRDTLMQTLKTDLAPNQAIFVPGHIWIPELADAGYITDLNELFSSISSSIMKEYDKDDILPSIADECSYKNYQYQLPFFSDGHILFYRKDFIDLDGEIPIVSTKEVYKLASKVHNPSKIYGLALKADVSEIFTDFLPYLWEANGYIFDKKGFPDLTNYKNVEALELYCDLKELCPPKTDSYGNAEISDSLKNGEAALICTWGGQIAPILLDKNNKYKDSYKAALFPTPWNATWGIAIPKNQPKSIQEKTLSKLLQVLGKEQDKQIISIAGSPVRESSYTDDQLAKYPWLKAQKEMLKRAKILPKNPKLGLFLGILYEAVHKAFTKQMTPKEALDFAQGKAILNYEKDL